MKRLIIKILFYSKEFLIGLFQLILLLAAFIGYALPATFFVEAFIMFRWLFAPTSKAS